MRSAKSIYSLISEVIVTSSQLHDEDLSDMIIVKKAIFKSAVALLTEDQIISLVRKTMPSAPVEKGISAFGKWLEAMYTCFGELLNLKTQTNLAELIGLSQSDISTLFNRPEKISLSKDRMKEIEDKFYGEILRTQTRHTG